MSLEIPVDMKMETVFGKILKSMRPDEFMIAGYAYPELSGGDLAGDSFDFSAMDEAFKRMMSVQSRRNLQSDHSNVQIGEIVTDFKDSSGRLWKSHVVMEPDAQYPSRGLFVVAKLFTDVEEGRRYIGMMQSGHKLSFSLGGEALMRKTVCDGKVCSSKVVAMDLHEISSCDMGVNPKAKAFFLKAMPKSEQPETPEVLKRAVNGASLLYSLESPNN